MFVGLGDYRGFVDKTDFGTLTRLAYCQCRLRSVFGDVFSFYNWTDIAVIIDRSDHHASTLGESLDHGLQINSGLYPYVFYYYSATNPDLYGILLEASKVSRGTFIVHLFMPYLL